MLIKKQYDSPIEKVKTVHHVFLLTEGSLCCAKCPTNAILLKHFTDEEINAQIDAALAEV